MFGGKLRWSLGDQGLRNGGMPVVRSAVSFFPTTTTSPHCPAVVSPPVYSSKDHYHVHAHCRCLSSCVSVKGWGYAAGKSLVSFHPSTTSFARLPSIHSRRLLGITIPVVYS